MQMVNLKLKKFKNPKISVQIGFGEEHSESLLAMELDFAKKPEHAFVCAT